MHFKLVHSIQALKFYRFTIIRWFYQYYTNFKSLRLIPVNYSFNFLTISKIPLNFQLFFHESIQTKFQYQKSSFLVTITAALKLSALCFILIFFTV